MLALVGGWCHQASPSLCPRWAMEIWPGHIIQHYPPTMACVSQYGLIWPRHAIWQSQAAFYRNLIICPHVEDILSQLASSLSAVHVNVEWICIINTHLRLPFKWWHSFKWCSYQMMSSNECLFCCGWGWSRRARPEAWPGLLGVTRSRVNKVSDSDNIGAFYDHQGPCWHLTLTLSDSSHFTPITITCQALWHCHDD